MSTTSTRGDQHGLGAQLQGQGQQRRRGEPVRRGQAAGGRADPAGHPGGPGHQRIGDLGVGGPGVGPAEPAAVADGQPRRGRGEQVAEQRPGAAVARGRRRPAGGGVPRPPAPGPKAAPTAPATAPMTSRRPVAADRRSRIPGAGRAGRLGRTARAPDESGDGLGQRRGRPGPGRSPRRSTGAVVGATGRGGGTSRGAPVRVPSSVIWSLPSPSRRRPGAPAVRPRSPGSTAGRPWSRRAGCGAAPGSSASR